jgi:hypothetical protein
MNIPKKILLMHKEEAGFQPNDLAGLVTWFDAADLATLFTDSAKTVPVTGDGDVVGAWADKAGNGNDVLQTTTNKKPLYKVNIKNGLAALEFNGTTTRLDKASYTTSQPHQIICVFQAHADMVNDGAYRQLVCNTGWPYFGVNAGSTPDKFAIYAGHWANAASVDSNWHCMIGHYDNLASNLRIDSVDTPGNAGEVEWAKLDIGSLSTGSFWKGYIAEILFYDPAIGTEDILLVENYLMNKWGLS